MPLEAISMGLKVGVEVLTKVAPKGLGWIATKVFGVTILAIGERRVGKSSFVNYFEYGLLLPEGQTLATLGVRNTASFDLSIGRDKSLRMRVRRVTDTRGHSTVKEQIGLVTGRKPTVLMIFLDASRNWNVADPDFGSKYLDSLLQELNTKSMRAKGVASRLKHFCVVLNKTDKIPDAEYQNKVKLVRRVLRRYRAPSWGITTDDVAIYRCIAIEHPEAVSLLDDIVRRIMAAVLLRDQ